MLLPLLPSSTFISKSLCKVLENLKEFGTESVLCEYLICPLIIDLPS